jgi:hypothetical protein
MALWKSAVLGTIILLGGCSFADRSLLPSLTGESPSDKSEEQAAAAPVQTAPVPAPQLNSGTFQPVAIQPGQATGTVVGQKIVAMRADLAKLEDSIGSHNNQLQSLRSRTASGALQYQQLIAQINAKLQVGTTPGNPILVNQWTQAQSVLERIDGNVASMNALANSTAADSTNAAFLLESARATYGLSGAVDEDHTQLATLEDETNKTVVTLDRLVNELSDDTNRQILYLSRERANLALLSVAVKNGELFGQNLSNRAYSAASPLAMTTPPRGMSKIASLGARRPLVVIRFDRPNVEYEPALYTAVSRALARKPNAEFDLVAVAPSKTVHGGSTALAVDESKRNADSVMRSLANMGLAADRVTLSATTSTIAETNEVHVYVR